MKPGSFGIVGSFQIRRLEWMNHCCGLTIVCPCLRRRGCLRRIVYGCGCSQQFCWDVQFIHPMWQVLLGFGLQQKNSERTKKSLCRCAVCSGRTNHGIGFSMVIRGLDGQNPDIFNTTLHSRSVVSDWLVFHPAPGSHCGLSVSFIVSICFARFQNKSCKLTSPSPEATQNIHSKLTVFVL